MKFLCEFKNFYKEGDIVLIEYWYNDMVTPVIIIEKKGNKYLVSHNVEGSKIRNAPDELLTKKDIISLQRV
jgi:hypothetical protein